MSYAWDTTPHIGDLEAADHTTEGVANLLPGYDGLPRVESWLSAFLTQIDSLEALLQDLLALRSVYTAEGVQLDTLGEIVQQPRGDLLDPEYRVFLLGKIYANMADGQTEQINELLSDILGSAVVEVREYWPAGLGIYADLVAYPDTVNALLANVVGGGIGYTFDSNVVAEANSFRYSTVIDAEESDASQGMGPMNSESGAGGTLATSRGRQSL